MNPPEGIPNNPHGIQYTASIFQPKPTFYLSLGIAMLYQFNRFKLKSTDSDHYFMEFIDLLKA